MQTLWPLYFKGNLLIAALWYFVIETPQRKEDSEKDSNEPKIVRDYTLLKVIGTGSFGKVFLVKNEDGEHFAMKVLNKENITDK